MSIPSKNPLDSIFILISILDLHQSSITSCGFSPQNDRIVTTSMDKTTKFFDIVAKKITISLGF